MIHRLFFAILAALASLAHHRRSGLRPSARLGHVKSELIYAPDGSVTGIRHAWTFDDMFSVFATQGLDSKKKGEYTREELAAAGRGQCQLAEGIRLLHLWPR